MKYVPIWQYRGRVRAGVVRSKPAEWPVALELARCGTPIGVYFHGPRIDGAVVDVVSVDTDGALVSLVRLPFEQAARWCTARALRIHGTLGQLADSILYGSVLGWLHGGVPHHAAYLRHEVVQELADADDLGLVALRAYFDFDEGTYDRVA